MNVDSFIAEYRRVTRDESTQPLWPDDEILDGLNEALNEACERALLIEDRTTPACCAITLATATDTYALHASVIKVKRITFRGRPLAETSIELEDARDALWETRTGEPARYILTEDRVRIVPIPTAGQAGEDLALTVYRRQITARTLTGSASAAPEINARYHLKLLNWMYFRGYSKADAETLNPVKAAEFEKRFTTDFGAKVDVNVQRKQRDRRPPVVRMARF